MAIEGKVFFSWEALDAIDKAMPIAANVSWSPAFANLVATKLEVENAFETDQFDENPPVYKAGMGLWDKVNNALAPFIQNGSVVSAISEWTDVNNRDDGMSATMKGLLFAGAILAAGGVGYLYLKRK